MRDKFNGPGACAVSPPGLARRDEHLGGSPRAPPDLAAPRGSLRRPPNPAPGRLCTHSSARREAGSRRSTACFVRAPRKQPRPPPLFWSSGRGFWRPGAGFGLASALLAVVVVGKSWPDGGVHATVDLSSARTGMLECYSDRAAKFEQRGRVTR